MRNRQCTSHSIKMSVISSVDTHRASCMTVPRSTLLKLRFRNSRLIMAIFLWCLSKRNYCKNGPVLDSIQNLLLARPMS